MTKSAERHKKVPLVWSTSGAQRLAQSGSKCRFTIHTGQKMAVTEHRLQFQDASRRRSRFLQPSKLRKRRHQCYVWNAEARTALDGLTRLSDGFFVLTEMKLRKCERQKGRRTPRIKRTQAQAPLAPFNCALSFASEGENNTTLNVSKRRRWTNGERRLECCEGRSTIMLVHANSKAGKRKS